MTHGPDILTRPLFGNDVVRACFDDAALVDAMLRVEVALARAEADLGVIPERAVSSIAALDRTAISLDALEAGTLSVGLPVPALVRLIQEALAPEDADWVHWGATSQDILDTAFCLCFARALDILIDDLAAVLDALALAAEAHRETLMVGRTRGQLATPITFGQRIAQWAQPLISLENEASSVRAAALRVQFGGASGSRSVVGAHGRAVASAMAEALELSDSAPWNTDRSGFLRLANWLNRLTAALGKIGRDLAILSRGEIGEAVAGVGGGSSTMPHKSNPVASEALQALAVLANSYEAGLASAAIHAEERDGGMWSVEWELLPALFETVGAALDRAKGLVPTIEARGDVMRALIESTPEVLAEAAVFSLAPELGRVEAKRLVVGALAAPEPFLEALAARVNVDLSGLASPEAFTAPSGAVVDEVFAARAVR